MIVLVELVLELLVELFGETLIDVAVHRFGGGETGRTTARIILFALLGAAIGAASLFLFPAHFIRTAGLRITSVLLTPILAGAAFAWIGGRRERKGKPVSSLEAFWPAYAFALAMAVVRYYGAE